MTESNKRLLIIFLVLVGINVVFYFISQFKTTVSFDENRFTLTDTLSVQQIDIGDDVHLVKGDNGWEINEQYPMDRSLRRLLMSILSRVKVKKPVAIDVQEGETVEIHGDNPLSFTFWGNPTKTKTYFSLVGDKEVYEVHIPGYNEYLGSIFELTPDQWRDRLLLDASWRTIQNLSLDYQNEVDDFSISFDKDFFVIPGVNRLDSNAVVDYLNQFQYFQCNEWISKGRFKRYDSLASMPPLAMLSIQTLSGKEPFLMEVFPKLPGERFHLVTTYDESMMVIDENRIHGILRKKKDFSLSD